MRRRNWWRGRAWAAAPRRGGLCRCRGVWCVGVCEGDRISDGRGESGISGRDIKKADKKSYRLVIITISIHEWLHDTLVLAEISQCNLSSDSCCFVSVETDRFLAIGTTVLPRGRIGTQDHAGERRNDLSIFAPLPLHFNTAHTPFLLLTNSVKYKALYAPVTTTPQTDRIVSERSRVAASVVAVGAVLAGTSSTHQNPIHSYCQHYYHHYHHPSSHPIQPMQP